jgi:hypothetical protein
MLPGSQETLDTDLMSELSATSQYTEREPAHSLGEDSNQWQALGLRPKPKRPARPSTLSRGTHAADSLSNYRRQIGCLMSPRAFSDRLYLTFLLLLGLVLVIFMKVSLVNEVSVVVFWVNETFSFCCSC